MPTAATNATEATTSVVVKGSTFGADSGEGDGVGERDGVGRSAFTVKCMVSVMFLG